MSLAYFKPMVDKYTPVFYLANGEIYFPSSMEWIMNNSTLIDHNTGYSKFSPTNLDLYNIAEKYKFKGHYDGDIVLSFSKDLYSGQRPLNNVPIYAYPRKVGDKIYITYILVFPFNGEYNILNLVKVGDHPFDIEHLTVELNSSGELLRVYFGFHGSKDGMWVPKDKLLFEDGKFLAFIALNGHGLYPYNSINFRLAGIANDYTEYGTKWTPKAQIISYDPAVFNKDTMGWIYYNGRLGGSLEKGDTSGITSLSDKGWIKDIDNPDETFFSKPILLGKSTFNQLVSLKNFVLILAIYFFVYLFLNIITSIINGDICGYPIPNHFITIGFIIVLFMVIRKLAIDIILKYSPK